MGHNINKKADVKEVSLTSQKIRDRRKQLGMTQVELAKKVGVWYGTVSRWEASVRPNLKPQDLSRIAEALNCDVNYLTGSPVRSDDEVKNQLFKIVENLSQNERSELLRYCLATFPDKVEN